MFTGTVFLFFRKNCIAQLMRIFVAIPESPLEVFINPKVQPGVAPCPLFNVGSQDKILLENNAIWVLRLPYPFYKQSVMYNSNVTIYFRRCVTKSFIM